jgi:hypothetical protein
MTCVSPLTDIVGHNSFGLMTSIASSSFQYRSSSSTVVISRTTAAAAAVGDAEVEKDPPLVV